MLYMVVEKFKPGAAAAIYQRACERGRMLPAGLEYVASWVDLEYATCFQLMRTDEPALFAEWTQAWQDLVEFEIVAVRDSAEAAAVIEAQA
ncbi:MAG: DUF3303 family protein [Acidobacteria bacterium]|nr:DUF3303 family protein [Acidobacteriota bacterium]MBI3423459.1 DUF3303 family protein [Acidobacteriota bacterium]